MLDPFRSRWPHLLLVIILLATLGPTSVFLPLAESLRNTVAALSQGDTREALAGLETAITLEPALWITHLEAASLALRIGDPERAFLHLQAMEAETADVRPQCLRAWALLMAEDVSGAEDAWAKTRGSCADNQDFYRAVTQHYWEQENRTAARSVLEAWALIENQNPEPHLKLGILLAVTQPEDAIAHLILTQQLSTEIDPLASDLIQAIEETLPDDSPAYTLASVGQTLMRHAEWTPAVWAFESALALDPDYAAVHAYLGLALDNAGENGYTHLRKALAALTDDPLPRIFLAYHWRMNGEPQKAKPYLEKAARLDPSNPTIRAELGRTYAALGDIEAAKDVFLITTQLAPDEARFWLLLAEFSINQGIEIQTLGMPAARNALLLEKQDPTGLVLLGQAHLMLGNTDVAERMLWRAVQIDPNRALTQYHLGLLRYTQGDLARAHSAWECATRLDPAGLIGELAARLMESPP